MLAMFYLICNFILIVLEVISSFTIGSLSISIYYLIAFLVDAFFRLYQSLCIIISLSASVLSKRPVSNIYTYGYDRTEILAAFASTIGLIFVFILYVI